MGGVPGGHVGVTAAIDRGEPWPGRERTAGGQARPRAALDAENRSCPDVAVMRRTAALMRARGLHWSFVRVKGSLARPESLLPPLPLSLVRPAAAGREGAPARANGGRLARQQVDD